MKNGEAGQFFLSYARSDQEFALRLATDLRLAGCPVWVDQFDILPSQLWDRTVEAAVRKCIGLILILSPRSVASDNVLDEVSVALDSGKRIIPVLHEKCVLPLRLARVQFIDATTDYAAAFERCKAAVLGATTGLAVNPSAMPQPGPSSQSAPSIPPAVQQSPAEALVPAAPARADFEPEFLDRVAAVLTVHMGPLARHIVVREQRGAADREDLYQRVSARIPKDRERADLLRKLRAL